MPESIQTGAIFAPGAKRAGRAGWHKLSCTNTKSQGRLGGPPLELSKLFPVRIQPAPTCIFMFLACIASNRDGGCNRVTSAQCRGGDAATTLKRRPAMRYGDRMFFSGAIFVFVTCKTSQLPCFHTHRAPGATPPACMSVIKWSSHI